MPGTKQHKSVLVVNFFRQKARVTENIITFAKIYSADVLLMIQISSTIRFSHEIINYQKYNTNKKMISITNDKENIQVKAIPICIFLVILCIAVLFLKVFNSAISIKPLFLILGFLIGFLLLIGHEILHGIVYPKNVNVSIGFIKPITFVALASYPMCKKDLL